MYQLQFYRGDQYLGGYGVREKMLVAMPGSEGWRWRDVSSEEVAGLLKTLGLEPIR